MQGMEFKEFGFAPFIIDHKHLLEESYRRSCTAGVNRNLTRFKRELDGHQLNKFMTRHAAISGYSHLLFSDIYRDLSDQNLFILTDMNARLIAFHSCSEVMDEVTKTAGLAPGILLNEESCGSNAVALALRYREPIVMRRRQHYCLLFHRWFAVAAPVLDMNRQPVACVAILNCQDTALAEKLVLAKFIAKEIGRFHHATVEDPNSNCTIPAGKQNLADLTPRQYQVLTLFAKGLSYKQIARELGIGSTKTVEEHLDAVRGKLHVSHRRECIQKAMVLGLLQE